MDFGGGSRGGRDVARVHPPMTDIDLRIDYIQYGYFCTRNADRLKHSRDLFGKYVDRIVGSPRGVDHVVWFAGFMLTSSLT